MSVVSFVGQRFPCETSWHTNQLWEGHHMHFSKLWRMSWFSPVVTSPSCEVSKYFTATTYPSSSQFVVSWTNVMFALSSTLVHCCDSYHLCVLIVLGFFVPPHDTCQDIFPLSSQLLEVSLFHHQWDIMPGVQRWGRQVCDEAGLSPKHIWDFLFVFLFDFFIFLFIQTLCFFPGPVSQLSDLPPTALKMDYAAVPLAQT